MPWSPDPSENPILTVNINTQFTQGFSYTDDGEVPETFSVTSVTAAEEDEGITTGTSVSGAYTGELHGGLTVFYLKKDGSYETVDSFDDISNSFEICSYTAPSEQEHTNTYTVTATGDQGTVVSANFQIVSVFNWDTGKTALLNAIVDTRVGRD
jgi:hypothetical protein